MANPNAAHEPSMEEILASIRQIISEDEGAAAPRIDGIRASAPSASPRSSGQSSPSSPAEDTPEALPEPAVEDEARFAPILPETVEEGVFGGEARIRPVTLVDRRPVEEAPLLSPQSGDAVSGAFGALAHTILAQNARTLEDVVTEMLQPMLKQWLDDNLPSIVERKVREEIERVSRGRR